jgi:hypothetical protein
MKEFVENPRFMRDRQKVIQALDLHTIDGPIVNLITLFTALPCCFPLQSCYGHFLLATGQDPHNLDRLPDGFEGRVSYRIAYVALCIEDSLRGRALRESLARLPALDRGYVQFGSAGWFWAQQPNSYVVQVEPARFMTCDTCDVEHPEALRIERVRDLLFDALRESVEGLYR